MNKLSRAKIIVCFGGLMMLLMVLFIFLRPPYNITYKKRDPVVLEWSAKLAELRIAASRYQDSIMRESYEEPDFIFPNSFGELHQWAQINKNSLLKSKQDWLDFEKSVKINYRTYSQIRNEGINLDELASKSVPLVEIDVIGSDGVKYKMQLLFGGLIHIDQIRHK